MKNTPKMHEDDAWDERSLGATAEFVRRSDALCEKALDDTLALQIISIRLQKSLIDDLKALASEDGLGYQPYIRQLLTQHVRAAKRKRTTTVLSANPKRMRVIQTSARKPTKHTPVAKSLHPHSK